MASKKSKDITVKIESAVCDRVSDLCEMIEKKLGMLQVDPAKEQFRQLRDKLQKMEEFAREARTLICDIGQLDYYD